MGGSASARAARAPLLTPMFALAAAANFLHGLALHTYLHFPGFLAKLHAGEALIGLIYGVTAATAIAARPWMGRVMDTRGRRVLFLAGGLLHAAVCALYVTVGTLGPWVVALRVLHGLAEAALFASLFTFAADIVPAERRTEGIALFGVSGLVPMSLGGVLGDVVLAHRDYAALFALTSVFALLGWLACLPLRERARGTDPTPSRGFLAAALQPDLLPLWFVGASFATALASVFAFLKTYIGHTHVGSVGLFFTSYSIAAVALRLLFGWVPDRVGPKRALVPSVLCVGAGLWVVGHATSALEVAIAGTLCGLGHGFTFPIISALVVQRARTSERGSAMAIFTAVFDAGLLIGGPSLGAIAGEWGYRPMYGIAAGSTVVGLAVFAWWDRKR